MGHSGREQRGRLKRCGGRADDLGMGARVAGPYVVGVDLDGVVADFYPRIRELAAEWLGVASADLAEDVSYGLREWGFTDEDYCRFHRFAVRERDLFLGMSVVPGAPQAIRRLAACGIRIRLVTHRLYVDYLHASAALQTVRWLDAHAIPYRDLCFMEDKPAVEAHLYVEDSPRNIEALQAAGHKVIVFTNSTNARLRDVRRRADTWEEVETLVGADFARWRDAQAS